MHLTGKTIDMKYIIKDKINDDISSCAYLALNKSDSKKYEVRFYKERIISKYLEDAIRFKWDLDAVSKLRNDYIARIHSSGEFEGTFFTVLDYQKSESLHAKLSRGERLSNGVAVDIIRQIAEALYFMHENGLIHKNLNSENVLLVKNGKGYTVKITGVGTSNILELSKITEADDIVNIFGFFSPETTGLLNKKIDERSDLYSLGVLFYLLLTGEYPFKGKEKNKIMYQQAAYIPVKPSSICANIPHVLDDMIMKLLQKEPDYRYQNAKELLDDLKKYLSGEKYLIGEIAPKIPKIKYQVGIIGRENEINKLKNLCTRAKEGKGGICFIGGEAGIGKSKLATEIKDHVDKQKGFFISGRCLDNENKTPYHPFIETIDNYVSKLLMYDIDTVEAISERIRHRLGGLDDIIAILNPSIKRIIGETKKLVLLEPERESKRFINVLADFFCSIDVSGSYCVMLLEDLQWADESTLNLLKEITSRISYSNTLIITTYRNNSINSGQAIAAIKEKAFKNDCDIEDIELNPLEFDSTLELIANMLGQEAEKVGKLAGYIHKKAYGNPLFTVNIVREIHENGGIIYKGGNWTVVWSRIKEAELSDSIIDSIIKKIRSLDNQHIKLLSIAAAIGRVFEYELLYRSAAIQHDIALKILHAAMSYQLIEKCFEQGKFAFTHDRIREAFYLSTIDSVRQEFHIRIAEEIEKTHVNNYDAVVFELAHHYIEGKNIDKSIKFMMLAAYKSKTAYANELAMKYYENCLDIMESRGIAGSDEWIKAYVELIGVYLLIGRNGDVICKCRMLMEWVQRPLDKARVYKNMGMAYLKKGDWDNCEKNLGEGLKILGEKLLGKSPMLHFRITLELFLHILHAGPFCRTFYKNDLNIRSEDIEIVNMYETLNWMYTLSDAHKFTFCILRMINIAQGRFSESKELMLSMNAYAGLCMALPLFKRSVDYFRKSFDLGKRLNDQRGIAQNLLLSGYCYSWQGNHTESLKRFEEANNMYKSIGDIWELGMIYNGIGHNYHYISDYNKSILTLTDYLDISLKTNNLYGAASAKTKLSYCYIEMGDFDIAHELLRDASELCEINGISLNNRTCLIYLGYLELEKANYAKAIEYLEKAEEIYKINSTIKDYSVFLFSLLADAYIKKYQSEYEGLCNRVRKQSLKKIRNLCNHSIRKSRCWPNHLGEAYRASANYYMLISKNKKAKDMFLKSVGQSKKMGRKYEIAKSLYEYGLFLQTINDTGNAQNYINQAYGVFCEIGSKSYIKKCLDLMGYFKVIMESRSSVKDRLKTERKLDTIIETGRNISAFLDIDELLDKITDNAMELVGAERSVLFLYSGKSPDKDLKVAVARNISVEEICSDSFNDSRTVIRRVINDKLPCVSSKSPSEQNMSLSSIYVYCQSVKSIICVPILNKENLIGVLYMDSKLLSGLFNDDDLSVVGLIAAQAGVSIENARLYSQQKKYLKIIQKKNEKVSRLNKVLEQRVRERTAQLETANNELREYAATVEVLTAAKERDRAIFDVHDNFGGTFTVLINLLEACKVLCENGKQDEVQDKLLKAVKISRDCFKESRYFIRSMSGKSSERTDVVHALNELFFSYGDELDIDFRYGACSNADQESEEYNGFVNNIPEEYRYMGCEKFYVLYKVCQEALTNSIRHGRAKMVDVSIMFHAPDKTMRINIKDDGCGCQDINKGFGLLGMEKRIKGINGEIRFRANRESGFEIDIVIPVTGG